jgi:tRNA(fMet)-specific endonuclease VapC
MIVLDTDHLTVFGDAINSRHARLVSRLSQSGDEEVATTIVSAEEQMRGWLAQIHGQPDPHRQIMPYWRLLRLLRFLNTIQLLSFDAHAANLFEQFRKQKIRLASSDLKIACIALAHDALLLSANRRHFASIPGLRLPDWLAP